MLHRMRRALALAILGCFVLSLAPDAARAEATYRAVDTPSATSLYGIEETTASDATYIPAYCVDSSRDIGGTYSRTDADGSDDAAFAGMMNATANDLAKARYALAKATILRSIDPLSPDAKYRMYADPSEVASYAQKLAWNCIGGRPENDGYLFYTDSRTFFPSSASGITHADRATVVLQSQGATCDENGIAGPFALTWSDDTTPIMKSLHAIGSSTYPKFQMRASQSATLLTSRDENSVVQWVKMDEPFYIRVRFVGEVDIALEPSTPIIQRVGTESVYTSEGHKTLYALDFRTQDALPSVRLTRTQGVERVGMLAGHAGATDHAALLPVDVGDRVEFRATLGSDVRGGIDLLYGAPSAGTGLTAQDPYPIYTAGQLRDIGRSDAAMRRHYRIMNDIDLAEYNALHGDNWEQIPSLYGSIDGQNHTIRGLSMRGGEKQALIGIVEEDAWIKDLHLTEVSLLDASQCAAPFAFTIKDGSSIVGCSAQGIIRMDPSIANAQYACAGITYGADAATIANCTVRIDMQGPQASGIVYGTWITTIANCTVVDSTIDGRMSANGIVDYAESSDVTDCVVRGTTITAERFATGIVNRFERGGYYAYDRRRDNNLLARCHVAADTTLVLREEGGFMNGLVRSADYGAIEDCLVEAHMTVSEPTVTWKSNAIISGLLGSNYLAPMRRCAFTGSIDASAFAKSPDVVINGLAWCPGPLDGEAAISDCYFAGTIDAPAAYENRIIGRPPLVASGTYTVRGENPSNPRLVMTRVYNAGTIRAPLYDQSRVAGMGPVLDASSMVYSSRISDVYFAGTIELTSAEVVSDFICAPFADGTIVEGDYRDPDARIVVDGARVLSDEGTAMSPRAYADVLRAALGAAYDDTWREGPDGLPVLRFPAFTGSSAKARTGAPVAYGMYPAFVSVAFDGRAIPHAGLTMSIDGGAARTPSAADAYVYLPFGTNAAFAYATPALSENREYRGAVDVIHMDPNFVVTRSHAEARTLPRAPDPTRLELVVQKVDAQDGATLSGSSFVLQRYDAPPASATATARMTLQPGVTGKDRWTLQAGAYYALQEVVAPVSYARDARTAYFHATDRSTVIACDAAGTPLGGAALAYDAQGDTHRYTYAAPNHRIAGERYDLAIEKYLSHVDGVPTGITGATDDAFVVHPGELLTFVLAVRNEGNRAARAARIVDVPQAGLTFDAADNPGWTASGAELRYAPTGDGVLPGAHDTAVVLRLRVDAGAQGVLENAGRLDGGLFDAYGTARADENTANDGPSVARVEVRARATYDLWIEKWVSAVNGVATGLTGGSDRITPVAIGDAVTYGVRVHNRGNVAAYPDAVIDDVPEGLTFAAAGNANNAGWTSAGGRLTHAFAGGGAAAIAAGGASGVISLTLRVAADAAPGRIENVARFDAVRDGSGGAVPACQVEARVSGPAIVEVADAGPVATPGPTATSGASGIPPGIVTPPTGTATPTATATPGDTATPTPGATASPSGTPEGFGPMAQTGERVPVTVCVGAIFVMMGMMALAMRQRHRRRGA